MRKFLDTNKILALIIVLFSISGLVVSFILTTEKIELIKNADRALPCTVNIIINCASVMKSPQAELLGFPNSLIGIIGYSIMFTFGMTLLFSNIKSKWYLLLANLGSLASVIFSYWLLNQSVYVIGALCPYCLISGFSATNIFFALTFMNLRNGLFTRVLKIDWEKTSGIIISIYGSFIIVWYVILLTLIYLHFGDNLLS